MPLDTSAAAFTASATASIDADAVELRFDVEAAILNGNVRAIWDPRMVSRFALLDVAAWGQILSMLTVKFGSQLCKSFLVAAVKLEASKIQRPNSAMLRGGMPDIQVNGKTMRDITNDSLRALVAANVPPVLFVRSGELCYVGTDERDRPAITAVTADHLRGRLDRCCNYVRITESVNVNVFPPRDIVSDVLALPPNDWTLPALDVVVEIPTLRANGSVLTEPGYDPMSRMYYVPAIDLKVRPIPDDPTSDEVLEAVALIQEPVADFPFEEDVDRANFFGLLMTPIVRPAITGCTPMALIDAPQAGTGKSLLADVVAMIITGRPMAFQQWPGKNEDEIQKALLSTLLQGRSLVAYDNLEGVLRSPSLAMALTAQDYEGRQLGVSQLKRPSNRCTWLATGNNIQLSGDLPRRCYHIRLNARSSHPELGRQFKHKNLLSWVATNRAELLRSLLIIARAWWSRGCPDVVADPLGTFEDWHRTIGGILAGAQIPGFLSNLEAWLSSTDELALQWEAFLSEIATYKGSATFTTDEISGMVRRGPAVGDQAFSLPDSLSDIDLRKSRALECAMGRQMAQRQGRRFGQRGLYLKRFPGIGGKTTWRIEAQRE